MTPQNKLYEAAKNVWKVADKINAKANGLSVLVPDEDFCDLMRSIHELSTASSAYEQEQPEAIAGENITTLVDESFKGLAELINDADLFAFYKQLIVTLYEDYTSAKDKEIKELKERISELEKRILI